jgi:hypothetical protein
MTTRCDATAEPASAAIASVPRTIDDPDLVIFFTLKVLGEPHARIV